MLTTRKKKIIIIEKEERWWWYTHRDYCVIEILTLLLKLISRQVSGVVDRQIFGPSSWIGKHISSITRRLPHTCIEIIAVTVTENTRRTLRDPKVRNVVRHNVKTENLPRERFYRVVCVDIRSARFKANRNDWCQARETRRDKIRKKISFLDLENK